MTYFASPRPLSDVHHVSLQFQVVKIGCVDLRQVSRVVLLESIPRSRVWRKYWRARHARKGKAHVDNVCIYMGV